MNYNLVKDDFKITESDIQARPKYLSNDAHLEAHFLTCFVALVYARILQQLLKNKYSCKKIIKSLALYSYFIFDTNAYMLLNYDEIVEKINNIFTKGLIKKFVKQAEVRRLFKNSKEARSQ